MATQTGFVDLTAYARGAETANAMNWQDVFKDISSRQAEEALMQNQAQFGLKYPLAQLQTEDATATMQANRQLGQAQAEIWQQALKMAPEQRTDFVLGETQRRLSELNPADSTGRMQAMGWMQSLQRQLAEAVRTNDRASAQKIMAALPNLYSPFAGQEAGRTQTQALADQKAAALNQAIGAAPDAPMYVAMPDGTIENVGAQRQLYQQWFPQPSAATPPLVPGQNFTPAPWAAAAAPAWMQQIQQMPVAPVPPLAPVTAAPVPVPAAPVAGTPAPAAPQASTPFFRPWVYSAAEQAAQNRERSRNFLLELFGLTPAVNNQQGQYR